MSFRKSSRFTPSQKEPHSKGVEPQQGGGATARRVELAIDSTICMHIHTHIYTIVVYMYVCECADLL